MAYERYEQIVSKEEFFKKLENSIAGATEELMQRIYEKYMLKSRVFQRDSFTCQNRSIKNGACPYCKNVHKYDKLTIHHVRFKKNNGEDKERNTVTLCRGSHMAYHRAQLMLVFPGTTSSLPPHIKGKKFKLSKSNEKNWKLIKKEMRQLRKQLKASGFKPIITWEQLAIIMKWLFGDENDD